MNLNKSQPRSFFIFNCFFVLGIILFFCFFPLSIDIIPFFPYLKEMHLQWYDYIAFFIFCFIVWRVLFYYMGRWFNHSIQRCSNPIRWYEATDRIVMIIKPILVGLFALMVGYGISMHRVYDIGDHMLEEEMRDVYVIGHVIDIDFKGDKTRLLIKPKKIYPPKGAVDELGFSKNKGSTERALEKIHHVRITGRFKQGEIPKIGQKIGAMMNLLPLSSKAFPQGFHFYRWFYYRDISAVGYATGSIQTLDPHPYFDKNHDAYMGAWFVNGIKQHRVDLAQRIQEWCAQSPKTGAVIAALLLGYRGQLGDVFYHHVKDLGLAHILAISGLHVGLLAWLALLFIRPFLAVCVPVQYHYYLRPIYGVVILVVCWGYCLLAGGSMPTFRACIMITFLCLSFFLYTRMKPWRGLGISFFLLLFARPESLFEPGFVLSFSAVTSIFWMHRLIEQQRGIYVDSVLSGTPFIQKAIDKISDFIKISTTATLGTSPLVFTYFHHLPLLGVFANLVFLPFFSVVVMPAVIIGLLCLNLNVKMPFDYLVILMDYAIMLLEYLHSLLGYSLWITYVPTPFMVTLALIVVCYTLWLRHSIQWFYGCFGGIFILCVGMSLWQKSPDMVLDQEGHIYIQSKLAKTLIYQDQGTLSESGGVLKDPKDPKAARALRRMERRIKERVIAYPKRNRFTESQFYLMFQGKKFLDWRAIRYYNDRYHALGEGAVHASSLWMDLYDDLHLLGPAYIYIEQSKSSDDGGGVASDNLSLSLRILCSDHGGYGDIRRFIGKDDIWVKNTRPLFLFDAYRFMIKEIIKDKKTDNSS